MSAAEYERRSETPFERPGPVLAPEPPPGATQYALMALDKEYERELNYVKEFKQMETTILQQIRETVEEEYIAAHLDPITSNFTCTIPELLQHLLDTYAYISPEELEMKRAEITSYTYTQGQPIDTIFQKINVFARLSELAKAETTEQQKIGMAQVLLVKAGSFEEELKQWMRKPEAERTWQNFMTFFRMAYREQKQSRPTLRDISLEANVVQKMHQLENTMAQIRMEEERENIHELLKTLVESNKQTVEQMKTLMQREKGGEKPRKMCQRCKKNGRHFTTYRTHWTKDCTKFPATEEEAPATSA
jgi:hypothetical protein